MRIGIIGMGWVGTSVAISVLQQGLARELLLNDLREELAEGEAMDLSHGAPFLPAADVRAVRLQDLLDCDAVVIAAGRNGKPGESRLELLRENAKVVKELGVALRGHRGLLVMVTNPVDVLTHVLADASGVDRERAIGTGTLLDTARMRQVIGSEIGVSPRSVHAHVVGEHGDSQVAAFSSATIGGARLRDRDDWTPEREQILADRVRFAAREIIRRKGATNHAIGLVTAHLLKWALRGENRVLTVSRVHDGALGFRDVALSLPAIVGSGGATTVLSPALDEREWEALRASEKVLREARAGVL